MLNSDVWDFPTHKFPTIGWLGRVHRGTPWQTIYLKAEVAPPAVWAKQSLDRLTHPTNDWRLLDVFTVAQTPNASHGQLSINQSGLAAWAAVFGGIDVISNTVPEITQNVPPSAGNFTNLIVDAANPAAIQYMVDGINRVRARRPNQLFHSLGELMSVPELSTQSPFINSRGVPPDYTPQNLNDFGFTDEAYERIPRQILSLLKVGDARYVVYAFGQALKPADKSIVTTGPFFGMCTNYQVTGEVYTRAVVKLEGTAVQPRPVILNYSLLPVD